MVRQSEADVGVVECAIINLANASELDWSRHGDAATIQMHGDSQAIQMHGELATLHWIGDALYDASNIAIEHNKRNSNTTAGVTWRRIC